MSTNTKRLNLGQKIRKARKEVGLSQKQLAGYLKLSDKAISAYEVGRATPSFEILSRIGQTVHKPINYFDAHADTQDIDLQIKIKTIEKELLEIKKLLER